MMMMRDGLTEFNSNDRFENLFQEKLKRKSGNMIARKTVDRDQF